MKVTDKANKERLMEEIFALPKIESEEDLRLALVGRGFDRETLERQFARRKALIEQKAAELERYGMEFSLAWYDETDKSKFCLRITSKVSDRWGAATPRRVYRSYYNDQREMVFVFLERVVSGNELLERMISLVQRQQTKNHSVKIRDVMWNGLSNNAHGLLWLYLDSSIADSSRWFEFSADDEGLTKLKEFLAVNTLQAKARDFVASLPGEASVRLKVDIYKSVICFCSDNPLLEEKLYGRRFSCTKNGIAEAIGSLQQILRENGFLTE